MKNLRKILAVVLVVCLALSLVTIGSAKFTDDSSIKYTTAVGVMTGLGAIDGQPDGSFNPTGSITRAEAAKLITFATLGAAQAKLLPGSTTGFSDVPSSHWAAAYIGYLVSKGIIGGRGNGTFDPNGNVTGAEMAKMLLCAVGFGKDNEFSGSGWEYNVISTAFDKEIFKNSAATDYSKAATREEAALYMFNTILTVKKVTYAKLTGDYTPGAKTIGEAVYGLQAVKTAIITGNQETGLKGTTLASTVIPAVGQTDAGKITGITLDSTLYKFASTYSQIGTVVDVYYKDINTIYYVDTVSKSISTLFGTTGPNSFATTFGSLKAGPATLSVKANVLATTAGAALTTNTPWSVTAYGSTTTFSDVTGKAPAGTYVSFGGALVSWIVTPVTNVQKVSAISTTAGAESITLSSDGVKLNNATTDVVTAYDGIAVGDLVQVTHLGTMYKLDKTTTITGTISKLDLSLAAFSMTGYIVDGKTYYAGGNDTTGLNYVTPAATDFGVTQYTLYLNATNQCFAVTGVSGAVSSVVYVVGPAFTVSGTYGQTYSVQTVDSSGKQVVYNAGAGTSNNTVAPLATTGGAIAAGFYKVTVNATTSIASFALATNPAAADLAQTTANVGATAVSKTSYLCGNGYTGGNYYFASDCQFIFVSNTGTTGATLKIEKVTGIVPADQNSLVGAMLYISSNGSTNKTITSVVIPHSLNNPTGAGTKLLYIPTSAAATGQNVNGYTYNVYIDGVKTLVTATHANLYTYNFNPADYSFGHVYVNYSVDAITGAYTFGTALPVYGPTNTSTTSTTSLIHANVTLGQNSIFNGYIDGRVLATGAIIIDNATSPYGDNAGSPVTSFAAMAALTADHTFTVDYIVDANGAIVNLFISSMTPGR